MRKEGAKGITLIALVITIIILLILAGITITQLTGSGLFGNAKKSKEISDYTSAKEIVQMKLMGIQVECTKEEKKYTIVEIAKSMALDEEITIEKYYNSNSEEVTENLANLKGIVVSVNQYSKYKFLIGEGCEIKGVTTGEITDTIESFKSVEEFEKEIFGYIKINENKITSVEEMLKQCGIDTSYNIEDIIKNVDNVLETIFENKKSSNYMLENYLKQIVDSEEAMIALGTSTYAKYIAVTNNEYMEQIRESDYMNKFDDGAVKVPIGVSSDDVMVWGDYYSGYGSYGEPGRAFDDWNSDSWYNSYNDGIAPKGIGYDFQEDLIIYKVECNTRGVTHQGIALQGSNDSITWKDISMLEIKGIPDNGYVEVLNINSKEKFSKFRIYASDSSQLNVHGGLCFQILQFYCIRIPQDV